MAVPARRGVACMRFAGRETRRTGRRDLIGAWLRPHSGVSADRPLVTSYEEETGHGRPGRGSAQAESHRRRDRCNRSQAGREDHPRDRRGSSRAPPLGGAVARPDVGARGLPPPVAAARCRARARRRVGRARRAQAHGRRSPLGARTGQERSDRRPRGRPGGPARTATCRSPPSTVRSASCACLVDHREDLVGERTRHEQRLRWFLVELAIDEPAPRSLGRAVVQSAAPSEPWPCGPNRSPASPAICWRGSSS